MPAPYASMDEEQDIRLPHPTVIRTGVMSEARTRTQRLLNNIHHMRVLDRERRFLARVQYRSVNGLGLMSSTYGPAVEITCSPPISLVTVSFVYGGAMLTEVAGHTVVAGGTRAAVFCYRDTVAMRWTPGMRQLMLTVEKPLVERYLRNLLDEPIHQPVVFQPELDLESGGQGVTAAVQTLRLALERCGKAGPPPVLAAEIEHGILTALLLGQRHNYTDAIFSARSLPAPRVVRRVVELIHSSPQTAFTVADLAAFAGTSERSLHAAFRRQLGTSPMSYVRRHRLEQAHEELLRLDPATGVTVTDVAMRYGFTHTGRFAAAYRARFGEPPSATLRR
ncbi:AraC family transcriptional regulator [Planosporangium mesophilum]|uniref:AraC family transcriptional regulator n=1 Tax=Planosporangium mesophilum TaxID=689768 RepID=A0A8J3X2R7_9ACTN|nr:AraC family transcriptional regulator [Planosporangium mesophilum]NJC82916.1 AraC family transcriptional regulator [Planosporangium mesophilum]GII24694.1 AraC family transcriptional regulator [Planosporangium mesophilum]